jgi:uncharacterized protein YkwD
MTSRKSALLAVLITLLVAVGSIAPTQAGAVTSERDRSGQLINARRAGLGLALLRRDAGLDSLAQGWADHLAVNGAFEHRRLLGPDTLNVLPTMTAAAENLGAGASIDAVHQALVNSPGHRANIDGNYSRMGLGVATDRGGNKLIVQNFALVPGDAVVASTPAPTSGPTIRLTTSE